MRRLERSLLEGGVILTLLFWLYYERIMYREEDFLREQFGETFVGWSVAVPAFVPRLRGWAASGVRFSIRGALHKERSTQLGVGVAFALFQSAEHLAGRPFVSNDWVWAGLVGASALIYLFAKTIRN